MLELILKSALGLEQIHELILEKSEIRRASIGSGLHFRSSGQPKSVPDLLPDSKTPMLPSLINPYLEKFLQKRKFNAAAGSRSMKQNLDTGVEVYDNKVKKKQRHTTNEKPNMYLDRFNRGVEEVSHWH